MADLVFQGLNISRSSAESSLQQSILREVEIAKKQIGSGPMVVRGVEISESELNDKIGFLLDEAMDVVRKALNDTQSEAEEVQVLYSSFLLIDFVLISFSLLL